MSKKKRTLRAGSFSEADLATLSSKAERIGTPPKALQALGAAPVPVPGTNLVLQPTTVDTFIQLEIAKSPFLTGGQIGPLEVGIALYIFTTDPDEADEVLYDRRALEKAARKLCRRFSTGQFTEIAEAIQASISAGFSSAIATAPESQGQKKTGSRGT